MPSTYSPLLRVELQAAGENNDTWGDIANTVFTLLENAIAKRQTLTVTTADVTLTTNNGADDQARSLCLAASGTLTDNRSIIVPALSKAYLVTNGCSGAFTLTVKTAAGSGIVVPQGVTALLYCDGTNVVSVTVVGNFFDTLEIGHASDSTLSRVSAGVLAIEGSNIVKESTFNALGDARYMKQGLVTIPILAAAMQPAVTNGAAIGTVESATNKILYRTLDFDATTQEFAGFVVPFPKSFDNGTVTFQPLWTHLSGTGTVVWALQAVARSNDDTLDTAYETEQTSTDTALTSEDLHIGPTSAAITIAQSPIDNDVVFFRIKRVPASDTLNVDARLIGIRLFFTQNAADDT